MGRTGSEIHKDDRSNKRFPEGDQHKKYQMQPSRSVSFTGIDSVYILPKPKRASDSSESSENFINARDESETSEKSSDGAQGKKVKALPAYVVKDDSVVAGYIVDAKSKHIDLLEENLLKEMDLYAEKLLDVIEADDEFEKSVKDTLLLPTVDNWVESSDTSGKAHSEVRFHVVGRLQSVLPAETLPMTNHKTSRQVELRQVSSSNSPPSNGRSPRGTLKENILRRFSTGKKDDKELKVSGKWSLCKQEQRFGTKTPSFSLNGMAMVGGQEVKSTVNVYIAKDMLSSLNNK